MAAVVKAPPFGRGRGRGRGLRANSSTSSLKPGPTAETESITPKANTRTEDVPKPENKQTEDVPKTETKRTEDVPKTKTNQPENSTTNEPVVNKAVTDNNEVSDILQRMETLSESEVMKTILPQVELIKSQETVEDLIKGLCQKSLQDPHFALLATKLTSMIWDNATLHTFIRNPLLKLTQNQYMKRAELRKENKFHGLCVYVCELFKHLRVREKPLKPVGDAVIQLLKELMDKNSKPTDEDVFYFYQEMENVGSVIEEVLPEKMEELINIARQLVISSSLLPSMRCRLVQLIELHASKWNMTDQLKILYDDMQQDLMSEGK